MIYQKSLKYCCVLLCLWACSPQPPVTPPALPQATPEPTLPTLPDETGNPEGLPPHLQSEPVRLLLQDEAGQPLANLPVRYLSDVNSGVSKPLQTATTDSKGYLPLACQEYLCWLQLQADGYWEYTGPYSNREYQPEDVQIMLAAKTPEEISGQVVDEAYLFQLNARSDSEDIPRIFPPDPVSGFSSFVIHSEAELETYLPRLAMWPAEAYSARQAASVDYAALMREALQANKVLVGFSNNQIFRYAAMIESVRATADSYYLSGNRSQLKTERGISGHTYDLELQVFAFEPKPQAVFDLGSGKQTLSLLPAEPFGLSAHLKTAL